MMLQKGSSLTSELRTTICMYVFVNEDRRLDFAKFAFSRASDKDKYYKLNKLFINEGRITDLTNYVKQNKNK